MNTHKYKHDSDRQKRRQSKDFNEIVNTQSDLNVSQNTWDSIFHNYENPELCEGRKRPAGCSICDSLQYH